MEHHHIILMSLLMLAQSAQVHKNDSSTLRFHQSLKMHHLNQEHIQLQASNRHQEEFKKLKVTTSFSQYDNLHLNSIDKGGTILSTSPPSPRNKKSAPRDLLSFSDTSHSLIKSLCKMNGKSKVCYTHGQSVCRCKGQLADCSGKRYVPNIGYAPKLPPEVKCLIFQYNNVPYLDESYFANVSDFRVVDFSYNRLRTVSEKTFARFNGKLEYLLLNSNSLTYKNIRNVLRYPPSKRLDLIGVGLPGPIPKNYFQPFANIRMSELYLDFNYLLRLDLREFSVLKNLKYLSVKNCSINEMVSDFTPFLEFLYLKNNNISVFPKTCSEGKMVDIRPFPHSQKQFTQSMLPRLKELYLSNNVIKDFPDHRDLCLPKLKGLDLSSNNISTFYNNSLQSLTSLEVIRLDRMKSNISKIESDAFSSGSLISLQLSKNHIKFNSIDINDFMFQNCPSLEVLLLDHNNFLNFPEESFVKLFSKLSRLTSINMGSCQMTFIPSKAFAPLSSVERLYLYINSITTIPPAAFDAMTSLDKLFLDQNQITTVSPRSFSSKTIQRLKEIDLNRNNFQCNCDLLWFQAWLVKEGRTKFYDFPKGYQCADRPGMMVSEFILSKQACLYSRRTYIIFTVCLAIFVISFIVFSIVYRYRWHIRIALYQWKSTGPYEQLENPAVTHDVFIVYCNDDSGWVFDELLHRVENEWDLRAFVHERDFLAGHSIIDNIVTAMNSCRHILVVLSSPFCKSHWCDMELRLCQSHVIEHDLPSILVVELETMKQHEMSAVVAALRSSTTFLKWPGDPRVSGIFWRKLEGCVRKMKARNRPMRQDRPVV